MSAPASSSWRIWSMVAAASPVSVLVIDCTVIGASPPTGTLPTWIWRRLAALDRAPGAEAGVVLSGHDGA